jgi:uncharacterized protein YbjT (DUF2867 family)
LTIGTRICRAAVQNGIKVISISRNEPQGQIAWEWKRGDIFDPGRYRDTLTAATGVIYTAGVLLEGDYKALAQGKFEPEKLIRLIRERVKGRNPLDLDPKKPSGYDRINRDGGMSSCSRDD